MLCLMDPNLFTWRALYSSGALVSARSGFLGRAPSVGAFDSVSPGVMR